jgi:hypothetical protein
METYTPDQIDCNTMVTAIAQDFGLLAEIMTDYARDQVVVIVRCREVGGDLPGEVRVQSLVRAPLKTAKLLYAMHYSALLDCWHQCDRGVLGAAARPVVHGWNGRPQQPRRRT